MGRENGHAEWYQLRYDEGYKNGYENGMTMGYKNGYDEGFENGYSEGFEEGVAHMRAHGYTIRNPTRREMLEFLAKDKTDEKEYVENVYVCTNFASDVCNNAENAGFRCAFVHLIFPEGGHALVAFDVVGEDLVFIEPQTDEEIEVEVGKPYRGNIVTQIIITW